MKSHYRASCEPLVEQEFAGNLKKRWIEDRQPYTALIELTPRCNFNCIHCYLQEHHFEKILPYDRIVQILDLLYEKGILFLTLTGGEVLTRKDFLDIYVYAKRKGFLVEVFTNGYAITEEHIETFKKYPPLIVDISLYGACEKTYYEITGVKNAFERVISNLWKLNRAGIRTGLKAPILKNDEQELAEMKRIAAQMGLPLALGYNLSPTIDGNEKTREHQVSRKFCLKQEFDDHEKQIAEGRKMPNETRDAEKEQLRHCDTVYVCSIASSGFVIDYRGQMLPCMKTRKHGVPITRETFDGIWQRFSAYGKKKASNGYKCTGCDARYYCDVCPAEMENLYGDEECRPEHVCMLAHIREQFYEGKVNRVEALQQAELL
ncbi:radical SAM protein [uncultured Gemmiger sp.]|uniref:radical SAM protein n=1 Tax=uncultured Gemmiger sp. TaxID=1623490 RepID=UPI0025EDFC13|nr:radical SAM protein [uncultured Gemmiger sp.]